VAIWSLDRTARLFRWAYCNLHVNLSKSIVGTKASATYDVEGDFVRLEIVLGSRMLKPGPGQHYYLYQPLKWKGWENHPFTLAAYDTADNINATDTTEIQAEHESADGNTTNNKEIQVSPTSSSSATPSNLTPVPSQHGDAVSHDQVDRQKLVFFIRPYSSWTKRLRQECLKSANGIITPHVFIEGPYGHRSPLHSYENVVLIVGGTGIAGALPYLQEHLRSTHANGAGRTNNTLTRDITLVWATKQSAMICGIAAHELRPMLGREDIHVHLYATSVGEGSHKVDSNKKDLAVADTDGLDRKINTAAPNRDDELSISYGRPNVRQTILDLIDNVHDAGPVGGTIAILTCGPADMADEARAAVHTALKQGKQGVEYFEETFGWVSCI
jgi:hypothetical protein